MIAQLRGQVAHRDADTVVVDVAGVGYLVHVAGGTTVPARGEQVELYTSLQVREDSMTLYGFTDRAALTMFELLLSSSGVGPRLALAALGTHRPPVLRSAIATGDVAVLTQISGVGKKVAERLVLELKDKIGAVGDASADLGDVVSPTGDGATSQTAAAEVREALVALGYSSAEAQRTVAGLDTRDVDTEVLLRHALRTLGSVGTGAANGGGR